MKDFTLIPDSDRIFNSNDPKGFELEVLHMQQRLSIIPWLQAIFGVGFVQKRVKSEEESQTSFREGLRGTERYDVYYPQGRKGDIDVDLSFDDTYASKVFFLPTDKNDDNSKVDKWNWVTDNVTIAQPFSLIVHCNLQSVEVSSYEQIKLDIIYALQKLPKVVGLTHWEDMQNVWKEFTITPELNGITRYPNYCLRVDCICTYLAFPYNGQPGYQPRY